jgi:hypothetical protein
LQPQDHDLIEKQIFSDDKIDFSASFHGLFLGSNVGVITSAI